ncbi:class I SAM-dependent methyltransferase [Alcanivorax sp. S6407]|uniref:class I SAM-dependent methyltransferase n=1 Tax=Alcanivorax sp. S6407 TaxID=2926424 RepID=UPI001FF50F80|nr:class I SAM-dependent methyltransferase [Alcanivorax sp. S6407]MCK0152156.1 class I SAM-dependent methyltransferase [Alcanivorax sp. S6407]
MENTTQLLLRQSDAMSGREVLVVDANDGALTSLDVDARMHIHADDFTIGAQQWAPLPSIPEAVDLLILPLPKSGDRLRFLLNGLAGQIVQPMEIWLVGPAKGGIKGALKHFDSHVDHSELVDSARHCKLYRGMLQPGAAQQLKAWGEVISVDELEAVSYPGVFSHGRLDEGSRLLLDAMAEHNLPRPGKVVDVGCGAGVLSILLARQGWQVQAMDVSATAVAACKASLERNGLQGQVCGGDLFSPVSGRVNMVVTNPPFHDRRLRTTDITRRLIEEAPSHLKEGGEMWLVANRELPYAQWLDDAFSHVQVAAETNRFRVYRAVV